jgi:intraflagellar transport protein 46
MCAVLDIPVYTNVVESLHVMLTTYLEFKNNPFLQQQHNSQGGGVGGGGGGGGGSAMML